MPRGEARQAEMPETDRQILGRRRGVVGQEDKGSATGNQGGDKLLRARNELILPVKHTVHINQVSCFHKISASGPSPERQKPFLAPGQRPRQMFVGSGANATPKRIRS